MAFNLKINKFVRNTPRNVRTQTFPGNIFWSGKYLTSIEQLRIKAIFLKFSCFKYWDYLFINLKTCIITTLQEARKAFEGVPTIQSMRPKQLQYVLKVAIHSLWKPRCERMKANFDADFHWQDFQEKDLPSCRIFTFCFYANIKQTHFCKKQL